jgi:hypothetical protein
LNSSFDPGLCLGALSHSAHWLDFSFITVLAGFMRDEYRWLTLGRSLDIHNIHAPDKSSAKCCFARVLPVFEGHSNSSTLQHGASTATHVFPEKTRLLSLNGDFNGLAGEISLPNGKAQAHARWQI